MGLFDGKGKQNSHTALETAEAELKQKLAANPLIIGLIENMLKDEKNIWLRKCQGYHDDCIRTVSVGENFLDFKWLKRTENHYINNDGRHHSELSGTCKTVSYIFTENGYKPLQYFAYDDGRKTIPTQRVCELLAEVVREKMIAAMPDCKFTANATNPYAEVVREKMIAAMPDCTFTANATNPYATEIDFYQCTWSPSDRAYSFDYKVPEITFSDWF